MSRLAVVVASPRVPAGLLSWQAWSLLRDSHVFRAGEALSPEAVTDGEVTAESLTGEPGEIAERLLAAARDRDVVWLAAPTGDEPMLRRLGERLAGDPDLASVIDLEVTPGSWDVPGARVLDVVALMDRLRSPGGCPWDAEQTHASLAPYLIEEAYEALESIETGDLASLREELGDVLLQVVFHARLAQEQPDGWTIDDIAGGLVEKLIRRHPHVFADAAAGSAAEVNARWETIKAAERGDRSVLASVPMGQPALRLAAALQRKAGRAGLDRGTALGHGTAPAGEPFPDLASAEDAAALLWEVVRRCGELGIDPEAALRDRARAFREEMTAVEAAGRHGGGPASH